MLTQAENKTDTLNMGNPTNTTVDTKTSIAKPEKRRQIKCHDCGYEGKPKDNIPHFPGGGIGCFLLIVYAGAITTAIKQLIVLMTTVSPVGETNSSLLMILYIIVTLSAVFIPLSIICVFIVRLIIFNVTHPPNYSCPKCKNQKMNTGNIEYL